MQSSRLLACVQVAEAVSQQMFTLNTNSRYLHGNFVTHAEALAATMPPSLTVMFATCSGSESNDLALRIATTNSRHGADLRHSHLQPSIGTDICAFAAIRAATCISRQNAC